MSLSSVKSLIALLASAALLSGCGGSHGSSAPPPVGGLHLEAGEGGVTLTWTGVAGVDYWAYAGQTATICKNCSTNDWKSTVGAQSRGWATVMSSPYFFTGNTIQTSLNNDVLYSFIMDGRINGGPGGEATASVSATPRLNGQNWNIGGTIGTGGITGLAFGPVLNTSTNVYATTGTYLGLGTGGIKYQSTNGLSWTAITSTDTTDWKSVTYAFAGSNVQKFTGVGAGGAVVYSTDLVTWTPAPSSVSASLRNDLNAVTSSSNLLVAVGNNGTIVRSTDGLNWVAATSVPSTAHLYAVKYTTVSNGVGLWVAVGSRGAIFISSDAATWSAVTLTPSTSQDLKGLASLVNTTYPNGVFDPKVAPTYSYSVVAVGNGGTVIQTADGINWASQTLGTGVNLNAIVASSALIPTNQFMVVGDGGKAFNSPDGINWKTAPAPTTPPKTTQTIENLIGLIRGYNNQYLAWAVNGTTVYSK